MILYERTEIINDIQCNVDSYVFTAHENFAHEWSLYAQIDKFVIGLRYRRLILQSTSLDELKIWMDIHIPGTKLVDAISYEDYVKNGKV